MTSVFEDFIYILVFDHLWFLKMNAGWLYPILLIIKFYHQGLSLS